MQYPSQLRGSLQKKGLQFTTTAEGKVIVTPSKVTAMTLKDVNANMNALMAELSKEFGNLLNTPHHQVPFSNMTAKAEGEKFVVNMLVNGEQRKYVLQGGRIIDQVVSKPE